MQPGRTRRRRVAADRVDNGSTLPAMGGGASGSGHRSKHFEWSGVSKRQGIDDPRAGSGQVARESKVFWPLAGESDPQALPAFTDKLL